MPIIIASAFLFLMFFCQNAATAQQTVRELGLTPGVFAPGAHNDITDVSSVKVGHITLVKGGNTCTGVTAILPHSGNIFQEKVPAAIYVGNGFGKFAGSSQVEELGHLETPIVLTNTLAVGTAVQALVRYTLDLPGNENIRSVNALVGETNDSKMNDIRGMSVTVSDVMAAIASASDGVVAQGSVGAGTGTVAFGYKGGIGSASRKIPDSLGGYTIGVLVQANFGGVLQIDGVPIGKELGAYPYKQAIEDGDGSCIIVVATDAPLDARNLKRLAKRGMLGLARTGGFASNGSGDYVIAFSTFAENFVSYGQTEDIAVQKCLTNDAMSPLFLATVESTEEAILNAIFMATIPTGHDNAGVQLLPHDRVMHAMRKYGRIP